MERVWTEVDDYLTRQLAPDDDALTSALADSAAAGETVGSKGYDGFLISRVKSDAGAAE